ncbi:hypothetical protein D9613_007940 [Agrocybe pediades]|uniref:Zn(2)-C6 fungal-type domain-containing protein n=1 Tax=Agrocybe pediades TaxID=84607 RepID=A0A8H4QMS9_9AGAR|nr:hypothetical protein D9613_007940 [Agrocybe pediades]
MPKSPRAKRSNVASVPPFKQKGAKCDERRTIDGPISCETCSRLRLECLGFGAKRPEWLREGSVIQEIRDKIKAHLAAQGMIKGHAGSGTRNPVQEEILLLSTFPGVAHEPMMYPSAGSSSSVSTPRREESVDSENPYPMISGGGMLGGAMNMYDHHHHHRYPVHSGGSLPSTFMEDTEIMYGNSLVDIPSRTNSPCDDAMMPSSVDYDQVEYYRPFVPPATPATRSSFSIHYNFNLEDLNLYSFDDLEDSQLPYGIIPNQGDPPLVTHTHPSTLLPDEIFYDSLRHYVDNVVKIQYLLGDKNVLPEMIWSAITNHRESRNAVSLLSKAYYGRQDNPQFVVLDDNEVKTHLNAIHNALERTQLRFTVDDAMTALHIVSLYLFDGGKGRWNTFLSFAVMYVKHYLRSRYYNPRAALEAAAPKDEFVIKTTIWFDVLAAITTQKPPLLLEEIRELFAPDRQSFVGKPPSYSMLSPMGCENVVVYALAETANLAYWKRKHEQAGDLSVSQLVHRVQEIDALLGEGPLPEAPQPTAEDWARYRAAEIFRTATRLLLKVVESGDYPLVPEIQVAAKATFNAIEAISTSPYALSLSEYRSAIVRSTVFGFFICGAFSTLPEHRHKLSLMLRQDCGTEGVGNCSAILELLEKLWDQQTPPNRPVRWRKILRQYNVLLV